VGVAYVLSRGSGENIGSASSIDCKMDVTTAGGTVHYRFMAKDIGSSNMKLRVEVTTAEQEAKLILDNGNQEAWLWTSVSGWQDSSAQFGSYWSMYWGQLNDSLDVLFDWTGGDYNYTDPTSGASIRFYDIQVNPTLPDSLFQPS